MLVEVLPVSSSGIARGARPVGVELEKVSGEAAGNAHIRSRLVA